MRISVLGPTEVDGDEAARLERRDQVVLAVLTVQRDEVVSADAIADALWQGEPPATWNKIVQGCVVRLRKVLGAEAIETRAEGYRLVVPTEVVDAAEFERLLVRGRELLTLAQPDRAFVALDEALALWRGRALAELASWDPGRIEASRLEELRREAEEQRLDAALQAGRFREVLAEAEAKAAEQPLREIRWTLVARAQYQAGRQGDALRTLRHARELLADELGLDPGPDLVGLEGAILRQDPALLPERPAAGRETCPYLGLVPYDVGDVEAFFGRDHEVAECLSRLGEAGVLVVVGPSGGGKSSLVRAGVAAALERDGRHVVVITPGDDPLAALAVADAPGATPVLVVDQCEEAITLCSDTEARSQFFSALATHAADAPLVVALRADRLGELSAHPAFARLVERGLYLLKEMGADDLRAAIEGPAHHAGLFVESGLVDLLMRDVEGEPGALPLLSHALRETWQRREGRTLTVAGYRASGGIRGAVAQSAEEIYERSPPEQRPILRDLLLRLVAPSPEGEPVRSRVPRRLVTADPQHEQVIELLVAARLVTSDQDVVEIAHEALARAWPRLRTWLDDDVEGQRILRHVAFAADTWEAMGRPDSELYRGARLAQALDWRDRTAPDLNPIECEFLDTGRHLAEAEERAAEEDARRQVQVNRRLRRLVAGVVVLALVAVAGGLVATRQAQRADVEAERADAEAAIARSHELAASAIGVLDEDPSLAKLLAVAAATVAEPDRRTVTALHRVWAADASAARFLVEKGPGLIWADIHPAGDRMVVAGALPETSGQTVEVVELASDARVWLLDVGVDPGESSAMVGQPLFADAGEHVVVGVFWDPYNIDRIPPLTGDADRPPPGLLGAHVRDAATGELVELVDIGPCGGWVAGVSPSHLLVKTLQASSEVIEECRWGDGTIGAELVDRSSGERELLSRDVGSWSGAALSGDGLAVAYDDAEAHVVVADAATGAELARIDAGSVKAISDDGSLVLVGWQPLEVWDVAAGEPVAVYHGHDGDSWFAGFGPAGDTVYSTGLDGALRIWDALTGEELAVFPGVSNGRLSRTDDGLVLIGVPDRDTVTLLDTRRRGEAGLIETCGGFMLSDSLVVAGATAAVHIDCAGDADATTYLIDVVSGEVLHTLGRHQAQALALSPDGTRFARQEGEGTVHGAVVVRDVATGEIVVELAGTCTWDMAAAEPAEEQAGCREFPAERFPLWASRLVWSPDGELIAAAIDEGIVAWDAATGELLHAERNGGDVRSTGDLAFSPDSSRLTATSAGWWIWTLSTSTWETEARRAMWEDGGYSMGLAGYTPDGSALLGIGAFRANAAGALHWFDPETLEPTRSRINVHEGSVRAAAMSDDGERLATGSSDGVVRVWDVATGDLVHELPVGIQVRGVAFVGDDRVAVALADGDVLVFTTDADELLGLVRTSLTRGFTLPECARFNFGDDDCPTLAELRGSPAGAGDPDLLAGTYRVSWTEDDLVAAMVADDEARGGVPLDDEVVEMLSGGAAVGAGTYTLALADGRFDIALDSTDDTWCTGTYRVDDDRLWMHSERGWCVEIKLFDALFEQTDDELVIDADGFRGDWLAKILLATRPLERIE